MPISLSANEVGFFDKRRDPAIGLHLVKEEAA